MSFLCLSGCRKLYRVAKFAGLAPRLWSPLANPCCECSLEFVGVLICPVIGCRGPV